MLLNSFKPFSILLFVFATVIIIVVQSCAYEKGIPDYQGYPGDIGKIIFTKCATTGCHTDASKEAAGGVSLETWDKLFEGGRNSSILIPFRHDYSLLFYYTNTFPDLGITLSPVMPFNKAPLTRDEMKLLKNWIDTGAPDRNGFVKFSDNPDRKKFYVTNQGCDVVTVFDQQTLLPMRYINVGNSAGTEAPHDIKVSPDGKFWYVVLLQGNSLQKFRTSDDTFVGEAFLGVKNWNTITLNNEGTKAYVVDWAANGDIAEVDLNSLTVTHHIGFNYPHGACLNPAGDTLYVTQQTNSNKLYKIPVNDFSAFVEINLYTTPPPTFLDTHVVDFSPDGTKYFVSCEGSSEVRILQAGTDQLLAVVPLAGEACELAISPSTNYLFVSSEEDTLSFPGKRGSVAVIDMATNTLIKTIYTGHQPHGISVDDEKGLVIVANRNKTNDGPAPHHSGNCGGRNGYLTFIELNTLSLLQTGTSTKKIEVSVDPYEVAVRP